MSNLKSEPSKTNEGVDLLYAPGESVFGVSAPMMHAKGWSVWPQTRDGARMPGRVNDECFKWGGLKNTLPTGQQMADMVRDCDALNVACAFGPAQADTFAVDVDCLDEQVSARVQALVVEHLGATPFVRVGRAPKVALLYRAATPQDVPASVSRLFKDAPGNGLEILSAGKPITLHGMHHVTGRYFLWTNGGASPLTHGPLHATPVTKAQVAALLAAVEVEFPFVVSAGGGAALGDTNWSVSVTGLRVPCASGPDAVPGQDGKLTDGREAYLSTLAFRVVTGNGHALLAAHGKGEGDMMADALRALTLSLFEQSAECSGRWTGENLRREVERKVSSVAAKVLAGNLKPYSPRPKCSLAEGDVAVAPRHEPEVENLKRVSEKPQVRLIPGEMPAVVDACEQALIKMGGTYQRAGFVVKPGNVKQVTSDGPVNTRGIRDLGDEALLEQLQRAATFYKFDGRKGEDVVVTPPDALAKTLKQRGGDLELPVLAGIVSAPTMRSDGSVLSQPGYDARTGLLYEPVPGEDYEGFDFENPTKEHADLCLTFVEQLLADFPFLTPADKSVALSALLTACVRRSLPAAPLHAFSATAAGSGKSKLASIASVLATGKKAATLNLGKSEEETEKRVGALLLEGTPVMSIDNVTGGLGSDFLCSMLTEEVVRMRILGRSETPMMSTNTLLTATGNNLVIIGDLTRRTLLCRLDPQCERPEEREFAFEPVTKCMEGRADYVGACLSVLRAYVVAGSPRQARPLGSFERWSDLVRGALLWLGRADPNITIDAARESDPVLEAISALLATWRTALGDKKVGVSEVIRTADSDGGFGTEPDHPDFHEALVVVAGESGRINSRKLGKYLAASAGRVVGGLRLVKAGTKDGSSTWVVEAV